MRWFPSATIPGAIFAITVLIVVVAALRAKSDSRDYVLQILRILLRSRDK